MMTYADDKNGEPCCIANRLLRSIEDWRDKEHVVDTVLQNLGGVKKLRVAMS